MKRCSKCRIVKPLLEFRKQKSKLMGVHSYCKTCHTEYNRQYRKRNRQHIRDYDRQYHNHNKYWQQPEVKERKRNEVLKRKFGITTEQYSQYLIKQNDSCAICGKESSESKRRLAVDHNHKTGKIRGLLCKDCNIALGLFKDDIKLLEKSISYLKQS